MRRWERWLLLLAALWLFGCGPAGAPADPVRPEPKAGALQTASGTVRLGTLAIVRDVEISTDRRVKEVRRIQATERFADLYRQQTEALRQAMRSGWQLSTTEERGGVVVTLKREFADFDTFNRQRAGLLKVEKHPLYEKIVYQDAVEGVSAELLESYPRAPGTSEEEWSRFLQQAIHFRYRVTFPTAVTSHNMDRADDGIVEWSRAAGEVSSEAMVLKAESKVYATAPVLITIGVIVLIVGAVVAVRLTRRYWDPEAFGE